MNKLAPLILCIIILAFSCSKNNTTPSFSEDLDILQNIDNLDVLENGSSLLAVSGKYQGRVFTSSSDGLTGKSYGYFNRSLIRSGNFSNKLAALGGESRMWFAPEVGEYAIFFAPHTEQNANTIEVSPALDTVKFLKLSSDKNSVTYGGNMIIRNANSYLFDIYVKRKISLLPTETIASEFSINNINTVFTVGFSAETWVTNSGTEQWKKEDGLISIWELSCFLPSENSFSIIPTNGIMDSVSNYFTPINDRAIIKDSVAFYKSDAQYMNKIGIQPKFCKDILGSYSPELNLLTIVKFSFTNDSLYTNSQWGHSNPYKGDAINIFNGEVNESLDRNWPFYELETLSSAKELKPKEKLYHIQSVYHFEGDIEKLEPIAKDALGISLKDAVLMFQ